MEMRGTVYLDCELTEWGQILDVPLRAAVQENSTNRQILPWCSQVAFPTPAV